MNIVRKKVISSRVEQVRPEKLIRTLTLKEFAERRNKILIIRNVGGLGDILVHRMMFEDFKRVMPEAEIHFCCPKYYHDALSDHPFVDKLLDSANYNKNDYIISYNTTTACGRTEIKNAPFPSPNRSDIWAGHCGLVLTNHKMHINLTEEEKSKGKNLIEASRDRLGKTVAICPISSTFNKNLSDNNILEIANGLRDRGFFPFCLNDNPINACFKHEIPLILDKNIRNWMSIINQVDYVISVDTASLHCAGGMDKPMVGIFTYVNGNPYCQYYKNTEVVQGPCKYDRPGCYIWGACPKPKSEVNLPCLSGLTSENILNAFDRLVVRFPL